MIRRLALSALIALAFPQAAAAQATAEVAPIIGTRLDISATGEISRVPEVVRITAGVVTEAPTAGEAMRQNRALMDRVRAALARAGIAERDVQTRNFSLQPVYNPPALGRRALVGYAVSNQLLIRFRDVNASGPALDALVAEGVNEIEGPILAFDQPEILIAEARALAVRNARTQADLYARAFGLRVKRVVSIRESGDNQYQPLSGMLNVQLPDTGPRTLIDPGGRTIAVTLEVVFELE